MISAAALLPVPPVWAVAVAGVGNAIFHVGGGVVCLRVTPQRATAPGLFVAPGSLGLLLGAILGSSGANADAVLATIAATICVLLAFIPIPCEMAAKQQDKQINRAELILGLILLSIAVRSLLGFLVHFRWDTQPVALLVLTAATVLGKALGGFWADRWGWMRVGIASMLTAMPFLVACPMFPLAAIPGLFLLNITMPITLAATANALPGYPGFAFGLTCLALLMGAIPTLLGAAAPGPGIILIVMLISGAGLYGGLRILLRQIWQ
jgi:FSR family fosmidomycin resistance protein-like MFS transporter